MPDDQNSTQNSISEKNSIPPSPQEPTEQGTENTAHSEPSVASPEALESSPNDFSVKSNDIPPSDFTPPEPEPEKEKPRTSYLKSQKWSELLIMARNAIQFRKRKKLDRVMSLFLKHSKITNDEVEKYLHVSDATASRYLSQLEKEGKIKQEGKTGRGVSYLKI